MSRATLPLVLALVTGILGSGALATATDLALHPGLPTIAVDSPPALEPMDAEGEQPSAPEPARPDMHQPPIQKPADSATDRLPGLVPVDPGQAIQPSRPVRSQAAALPVWPHHAWPESYFVTMPYGEAQFERFRSSYLSPGGRSWLEAVHQRSRPFAAYIYRRLRDFNLPEELFFLPFIESEYLPKAVSKSGAMGLWQFMRNSIAGLDMHITEWLDERRDFMKSTDGALRKLQWNYNRFGDWLLAIAAYNCGAGAMDRAIAAGGVKDFWALREKGLLPAETASYIPKFLAVVSVAKHAGRNRLKTPWVEAVEWIRVPVDRPVDIGMLAEASGIPQASLLLGNSELRHTITPPEGLYELKVPAEYLEAVRLALASSEQLMSVHKHTVRSGDTVSAIARHHGVSVALIAKLNPGLVPDRIFIGQSLTVPILKDQTPYQLPGRLDDELLFDGRHKVAKGETLWSLSLIYGVQPEVLAEKNGLNLNSVLREGIELIVPILN